MTDVKSSENQTPISFSETGVNIITDWMKEASDNLYHTSKEKYYLKAGLIEKADDMTTKEKLGALD